MINRSNLSKSQRSPEEIRQLEETIASIRLRTRHHDPYEEWEKQTRKEAFVCHENIVRNPATNL